MKKCEYNLTLTNNKGKDIFNKTERKNKVILMLIKDSCANSWIGESTEKSAIKIFSCLKKSGYLPWDFLLKYGMNRDEIDAEENGEKK